MTSRVANSHFHVERLSLLQLSKLLLKTGEKAWQPSDFVPDLSKEGWEEGKCAQGCVVTSWDP